ncbi:hypothetical protein J41TS12_00960 [Paenibacillus antibioticophila]|uniref:Uncharacterized protein n=1 Tax=Paenibacillus antibioticophila TaxID=1274374 RepID=A0A919XQU1_9BACL|nr:DUF5693 family protein [Paenibacillus antibioticophila]GIO35235.1 hypothetical protein J41TS12_00960 [Paenibacillus antibioticophila]
MIRSLQRWNEASRKWLWVLVIIAIVASVPVIVQRVQTESSANQVEVVFNYRGLLDVSAYQGNPQAYLDEQLDQLKEAGVNTMAMFESTLDELSKARRIMVFNAADAAKMSQTLITPDKNYTYVAFTNEENATQLRPMIEESFRKLDVSVAPWNYGEYSGLMLGMSMDEAVMKPMALDPFAFAMLREKGFNILPRLSDNIAYDQEEMDETLAFYAENGVKRILFDGEAVKGYKENAKLNSLQGFADLLNKHGIGIAAIENLKAPQKGLNQLAYLLDYNVVRLHSLQDTEASQDPKVLADRFVLATKDRNIRMIYLNASPTKDAAKVSITNPINNLMDSLTGPEGAIQRIQNNGFEIGQAKAFVIHDASWQKVLKAIVVLGGVAMCALLVSYFVLPLTLIAFVLGLVGSAGLYVLNSTLMEQALALGVAISAPTVATLLAIRKVKDIRQSLPELSAGRRLTHALVLYIKTSVISLAAVPFVIALLNNITYSLVLNQFRGVSLLHLAPILLIAIYVFLYQGTSIWQELRNWLKMPITLLWVVVAAVLGAAALYYLSRTGNAGTLLPGEAAFRSFLENTFGVRPRNKEFLLAHPLFLVGIFAAFRYRWAMYAMIIAVMGQLSMVDTFAHIHTPAVLSLIRGVLGLGLGLIVGLIAIAVWHIIERCWDRWSPKLLRQ